MMKNVVSQEYRPGDFFSGQIHEMMVTLGKFGFSPEMAAIVADAKSGKASQIVSLFAPTYKELLEDWRTFYKDVFGIEVDFSTLQVPEHQKCFDRLVVVAQGMTFQRLYQKCEELFLCWRRVDESPDDIFQSEWTSKDSPYAVWFRDRVEADEDLKNLSANVLAKNGIPGITLEERLLMELKYFKKTGRHLDVKNITLCSGSRRDSAGQVPCVGWSLYDLKLGVFWYSSEYSSVYLRSRRAVR